MESVKVDLVQQPANDDVIFLRVDINNLTLPQVIQLHEYMKQKFPDNKVVTMPIDCQISRFRRKEFDRLLEGLKEYLDDPGQE